MIFLDVIIFCWQGLYFFLRCIHGRQPRYFNICKEFWPDPDIILMSVNIYFSIKNQKQSSPLGSWMQPSVSRNTHNTHTISFQHHAACCSVSSNYEKKSSGRKMTSTVLLQIWSGINPLGTCCYTLYIVLEI